MRAVVLREPNDLALLDVPMPEVGPGWALVRVTHCGICGSDIRYLRGDNPWAKQTLGEKRANPTNIILGHEVSGVVERVADGVDASLAGRRVAVLAFGTCGSCFFCRRGEEELCPNTQHLGHGAGWGETDYYYGGMAEYVPVQARWLYALPQTITNEAASLLDPLGVAVHGLKVARLAPDETVLIVGCGPVGALAIQVAKAKGAGSVIVADICDPVLEVARSLGADRAVNPARDDIASAVAEMSAGIGARVILDTIGAGLDEYLPMLARGGRYVTMTVTDKPQEFRTVALAGERSIASSCNFQYDDYDEALALLAAGKIDASTVITHRLSLADALEAFRIAEDKESSGAVKVTLGV